MKIKIKVEGGEAYIVSPHEVQGHSNDILRLCDQIIKQAATLENGTYTITLQD